MVFHIDSGYTPLRSVYQNDRTTHDTCREDVVILVSLDVGMGANPESLSGWPEVQSLSGVVDRDDSRCESIEDIYRRSDISEVVYLFGVTQSEGNTASCMR